jgi:hypothetical protein
MKSRGAFGNGGTGQVRDEAGTGNGREILRRDELLHGAHWVLYNGFTEMDRQGLDWFSIGS